MTTVLRETSAVEILMLKRLDEHGLNLSRIPCRITDEGARFISLDDVDDFVNACAEMLAHDPAMIGLMLAERERLQ